MAAVAIAVATAIAVAVAIAIAIAAVAVAPGLGIQAPGLKRDKTGKGGDQLKVDTSRPNMFLFFE